MAEHISKERMPLSDFSKTEQQRQARSTLLRSVPNSARHFWKHTLKQQLSSSQSDNKPVTNSKRNMTGNELTTMALNEIAVSRGRGFFFHLLCRDAWTSSPAEEMHPKSRVPPLPGHRIPSLMYMNYVWSMESRSSFFAESHRGRYLKSDFLINPPSDVVPLYAVQYVSHSNQALYTTEPDSLILAATDNCYYLIKGSELKGVGGLWPANKRVPKGPDRKQRLNTAPYLWDAKKNVVKAQLLQARRLSSLEDVYNRVVAYCIPTDLIASFSAIELRRLLPRPTEPELGTPLGITDATKTFKSADPPTRRGERHMCGPRKGSEQGIKRKFKESDEEE